MIIEEKGDLFTLDKSWAFAHCVGSDFAMGAGIAVLFRQKYGHVDELTKMCTGVGTAVLLSDKLIERNVFYLVTKQSSGGKPTYTDIKKSLKDMFLQAEFTGIKKIAMPKIACGLDGKDWNQVKALIRETNVHKIEVLIRFI